MIKVSSCGSNYSEREVSETLTRGACLIPNPDVGGVICHEYEFCNCDILSLKSHYELELLKLYGEISNLKRQLYNSYRGRNHENL